MHPNTYTVFASQLSQSQRKQKQIPSMFGSGNAVIAYRIGAIHRRAKQSQSHVAKVMRILQHSSTTITQTRHRQLPRYNNE